MYRRNRPRKREKLVVIVAYAPTQVVSESQPNIRESFYNDLSKITRKLNRNRHLVITLGDFNAKTGSGYNIYPENREDLEKEN